MKRGEELKIYQTTAIYIISRPGDNINYRPAVA